MFADIAPLPIVWEPSIFAVVLFIVMIIGGVAGANHCFKIQKKILEQTTRILGLCESLETFYDEAVDARQAIEIAVAAGIAKETLTDAISASVASVN